MKAAKQPQPKQMTPSWDLVEPNFRLIQQHYLPFIYLVIIPGLVYTLGTILFSSIREVNDRLVFGPEQLYGGILMAIGVLWTMFNIGPATLFLLNAADGRTNNVRYYYKKGLRFSLRVVYCYMLAGMATLFGLLLLIAPGLIALRRYYLSSYYVVDKDLKVFAALKRSATDSKPVSGAIWGILGVQLVFVLAASVIGIIPLIGVVLSEIIAYASFFVAVLRYREINPKPSYKKL